MFEKIKIKRIDLRAGEEKLEDKVVAEVPLTILVNNKELATLLCSPVKLKELAVGYLIAEGFISEASEITSAVLNEKTSVIKIETKEPIDKSFLEKKRIITSGCGRGQSFYNYQDFSACQPIESDYRVTAKALLDLMNEFQKRSIIFKETGGVHSAALCKADKIIAFSEDIGRHNAVDKIIGEAALRGEKIEDKFLLTSGRISSEILVKASRLRVPLIISRSAPTNMAVRIAKQLKITLVGFARGNKLNVYMGDERIL
ncbi:MAG: formate dehydrogenase accessory sulfurtransferase FdhD [Candidatus Margulisiibacteriota bacterium]